MVDLKVEGGRGYTFEELKTAVETHKPAVLFLCQVSASATAHTFISQNSTGTTAYMAQGLRASETMSATPLCIGLQLPSFLELDLRVLQGKQGQQQR